MTSAIELKNVSKQYKDNFKVENINLEIEKGTITGFIGENGAGKTTIIKLILGILSADKGTIKISNEDIKNMREDIGVVLDNMFFPMNLNASDINSIMKDIYTKWDSDMYFEYLKKFGIEKKIKIKNLSKGMKKKLEIATALSHKPKLLILDEPTSGLDPVVRSEVLDIFLDFIQDEENTVFLSTHITSDLEKITDNIIFIENGKILLDENRDDILNSYGILKCDIDKFSLVDRDDILNVIKTKYYYEILVKDKLKAKNKYPECVVDDINLEDLMVLMIKGERLC